MRATSDYDLDGHYVARIDMILGLLSKVKKDKRGAIAHLTEVRRILSPARRTAMLDRIEETLSTLNPASAF